MTPFGASFIASANDHDDDNRDVNKLFAGELVQKVKNCEDTFAIVAKIGQTNDSVKLAMYTVELKQRKSLLEKLVQFTKHLTPAQQRTYRKELAIVSRLIK